MGSVIDTIECPNCKKEDCYVDFYYKTGEEYTFCSDCGYSKQIHIINREKNLNELTDDDWRMDEVANPWGCFRIKEIGMVGWNTGVLTSEEEYNQMYDKVLEHLDSIDEFSLSRLVDGKIEKKMVVSSAKIVNEIID
jgi:hypothetical protein